MGDHLQFFKNIRAGGGVSPKRVNDRCLHCAIGYRTLQCSPGFTPLILQASLLIQCFKYFMKASEAQIPHTFGRTIYIES